MYKILLIKDKEVKLDFEDYEIAKNYKWFYFGNRICTRINRKNAYFNKIVFNCSQDEFLYHKNGDDFDYRRENLECISRADYSWLKIKRIRNTEFNNVYYEKRKNMWFVVVIKDQKQIFGGRYYDKDDAAIVADYLNYSLHGDLRKTNFEYESIEDMIQKYVLVIERNGVNMVQRISRTHQGKKQKINREKTSKFVGVSKHKGKRKCCWCAEIRKDKKRYCLGYYMTEEEAARVYDKKAIELYGEDANTNFPKEDYLEILRALSDP